MKFDLRGNCKKCRKPVQRLVKTKTWHHVEHEDYLKCGYVEVGKKYVIDLEKLKKTHKN